MSKNVVKSDATGKKGILSCCKSLFEKIGANLAHVQPAILQNVQTNAFLAKKPWESMGYCKHPKDSWNCHAYSGVFLMKFKVLRNVRDYTQIITKISLAFGSRFLSFFLVLVIRDNELSIGRGLEIISRFTFGRLLGISGLINERHSDIK